MKIFVIPLLACVLFSDVGETYERRSTFSVGFSYGSLTNNDIGRYVYEIKNNRVVPTIPMLLTTEMIRIEARLRKYKKN